MERGMTPFHNLSSSYIQLTSDIVEENSWWKGFPGFLTPPPFIMHPLFGTPSPIQWQFSYPTHFPRNSNFKQTVDTNKSPHQNIETTWKKKKENMIKEMIEKKEKIMRKCNASNLLLLTQPFHSILYKLLIF